MTKESGLGDNFYVTGYNLSGDIGVLDSISSPLAVIEVTGIDKGAFERIGGLRDGQMAFTTYFNTAAGQEHPVLSALPSTDVVLNYFHGSTIGNVAAGMVGKQVDYAMNRADDGAVTFKVSAAANSYGLDWGNMLTAGIRTDTSATNGASFDTTASQTFGLQAYLHVFSVTGTSVTVKIQDSADNSSFTDVSGAAFTAVNAGSVSGQRIAVTGTVRRYLRVATTGTFSNAQFAVMVNKNTATVSF